MRGLSSFLFLGLPLAAATTQITLNFSGTITSDGGDPVERSQSTIAGTVAPLGAATLFLSLTTNHVTGVSSGSISFTFANGDSVQGPVEVPGKTFTFNVPIAGGTGSFAGAIGALTVNVFPGTSTGP